MKIYRSAHFLFNKKNIPYLIAGLGNPGKKYLDTRHNIGFEMLDAIAAAYDVKIKKIKFKALIGEGIIGGKKVILAKPQTFMNLSGESIREIKTYYNIPNEKIIVIFDDTALETGKIRIRAKGGAGGHNGASNIIYNLKSEDFPRIRIGIGSPADSKIDYVLGKLSKREIQLLISAAEKMPGIIKCAIAEGIDKAMNFYNADTV